MSIILFDVDSKHVPKLAFIGNEKKYFSYLENVLKENNAKNMVQEFKDLLYKKAFFDRELFFMC